MREHATLEGRLREELAARQGDCMGANAASATAAMSLSRSCELARYLDSSSTQLFALWTMLYFLVRPLAEEIAELSERGTFARYAVVFAVCFVASLSLKPHLKPLPQALFILRSFCGGVGRYTHSLFTQYVTQSLARLLENQPFIIFSGALILIYSLVGYVLMYA